MIFNGNLYHLIEQNGDTSTSVHCLVRLLPESEVFAAHFPGHPVLPGACIVQMVCELFALWQQREASLQRVDDVKFLAPVSPDAVSTLAVHLVLKAPDQPQEHTVIKATLANDQTLFARLTLILKLNP